MTSDGAREYTPLAGLRILDLTGHYAGAHITRLLADLGAEVIKVEATQHIDMVPRGLIPTDNNPTDQWWERAAYYIERNINKRGITLDLDTAAGKEVFYDLLRISDVLAENYTPRVMRNFGFDEERIRAAKADIIWISLSGYGQEGPLGNSPANAAAMLAAAGMAKAMALPDEQPIMPAVSLADMFAGVTSVAPLLIALRRRRLTGQGERIDSSGREAGIGMVANFVVQAQRATQPAGARAYLTVLLQCSGEDSWLLVACRSTEDWRNLCALLGVFDVLPLPEDGAPPEAVAQAARGRDAEGLAADLQRRAIAAAPCLSGKQLLTNAHFRERDIWGLLRHDSAGLGTRPYGQAFPVRVSGARHKTMADAPMWLGRDNDSVFRDLLGYSEERIAQLYAGGVAGHQPTTRFGRAWATPIETDAMFAEHGALPAPDYLDVLSATFGERIGPREG